MSKEARMKKAKQLEYGEIKAEETNNGKLSTLIRQTRSRLKVLTKTSDSTSTDHSILSQNSHSTELLNVMVPITFGSRDGETTLKPSNGTSMESLRLSRTTTGNPIHSTSNPMEDPQISDAQPPTQDGGNSSELREDSS
jgi:hypothetical protein